MEVMRYILYAVLIASALMTVQTKRLRRSVIYLGIFSLVSSLAYLLLYAPDVAIAEAIIGCTISVILFLTALKRYRTFTIYYVPEKRGEKPPAFLGKFEQYLYQNEFDTQVINTSLDDENLHETDRFDVLVMRHGDSMTLYSSATSYHSPLIQAFLEKEECKDVNYFSLSPEDSEYEA
jgi:uncharacterized MnhB-related membrane protein